MKQRLPLLMLSTGLIFLLAGLGVAYGLWSEILQIDGIVYTGEVYGEWTSCICTDVMPGSLDPTPADYGLPWPYPYPSTFPRKDVGSTSCTIDKEDPRLIHLTIQNGYPSYWGNCEVHFANTGSVPIIIRGYKVVAENFKLASKNGAEDGELWVKYWDGVGAQLEPCPAPDGYECENAASVQYHVEQPALENYTYEFDVLVCIAQWNETATLEECLNAAP
ncbi:MAG: hypothetical protein KJZ72_08895 [Anaerolineales bacterium]|jgi:hypothetical protein|nr:hypothetical protein [Anaerolineales bacterium]